MLCTRNPVTTCHNIFLGFKLYLRSTQIPPQQFHLLLWYQQGPQSDRYQYYWQTVTLQPRERERRGRTVKGKTHRRDDVTRCFLKILALENLSADMQNAFGLMKQISQNDFGVVLSSRIQAVI